VRVRALVNGRLSAVWGGTKGKDMENSNKETLIPL
jgi:hypothetical protein